MYGSPTGTTTITTSTQVVPTTYHARVFNINFMSAGTSSTIKIFDNGSAGTLRIQEQNITSNPKTVDYGPQGQEFANGIYVQLDASVVYATIAYRQEEKS